MFEMVLNTALLGTTDWASFVISMLSRHMSKYSNMDY